jgi:probable HAF family extracellular repeat protein
MGISADGETIVGTGSSALGQEAFRWTAAEGMVGLGDLPGGGYESSARAISADSAAVVGSSISDFNIEAFRWTAAEGMIGLGYLHGTSFGTIAYGASDDGATVVGISDSASGAEAFIWDAIRGMRALDDVLTLEYGFDLTGWTLYSGHAVSADGLVIAGRGLHNGAEEVWIVSLRQDSIAAPVSATFALFGFGLVALGTTRIRRCPR